MHPAGPLIAHRGASAACPENTLAALDRARQTGCGWVEIDAQVLSDGAVILMHDHDLDRTTDGTGPVVTRDLAHIRALRTRDPASGAPPNSPCRS
jgi:glycerophosphoryl diester phosphodiesterase